MADDLAPDDVADGINGAGGPDALTPEQVAYRSFAGARRGVSEAEVREFLQEVAAEMAAGIGRERDLIRRVHELEQRVAHPPPPTEEQILDHLGEETARVLRSAQEAAEEIRSNATARAQAIVEQAEAEAARIRQAAEAALGEKKREAEVAATVIKREADGKAQAELRQAGRDAAAEIAAARQRGRDMVGEARAVRERILADLGMRRATLENEVAQLQSARTELVEAGRVAKATPIVPELADVEPELATDAPEVATDEPEETELEPVVDEPEETAEEEAEEAEAEQADQPEEEREEERAEEREESEAEAPEKAEHESEDAQAVSVRPQVEELFARIRADRSVAIEQARAVLQEASAPAATERPDEEAEEEASEEEEDEDALLLEERDELLAPVHAELVRRCKRALQDEQNELLDRLRRRKGRSTAEELLIPLSVQVTDWADVLEPAIDEAYRAGRSAQENGASTGAPRRLVSGLAELVVTPFRERLVSTLDAVPRDEPDRVAELTSRVGARYREWRAQELESRAGDLLATAYTRGIYDAAPEGVLLRWVPAAATRCADCDDNALEPTARGAPFPTGQPFPPAHPGCRCLLAIDDA